MRLGIAGLGLSAPRGVVSIAAIAWVVIDQTAATYTVDGREWKFNTPELSHSVMAHPSDPNVLKFEVHDGDTRAGDPSDRHRSELSGSGFPVGAAQGENWVAYSMVPLQLPANHWTTLYQLFGTTGAGGPILKLEDRGGKETEINIAGDPSTGARAQVVAWNGPRFEVGRRYDIVWRIVQDGAYGEVDLWIGGQSVLSLNNHPIGFDTAPEAYHKYGIYADDNNRAMGDAVVIFGPLEIANGADALAGRVTSPVVPSVLAGYPSATVTGGTKRLADGP